jgi:cytochrome bd-type quinol oxidase subunit 2
MKKSKKITSSILIFFSFLFVCQLLPIFGGLSIAQASATDIDNQIGFQNSEVPDNFGGDNPVDIREMIIDLVKIFLTFLAIIFLILIIWGGYQWMVAGGNGDKVEQAKNTIKNGAIGMIIIMCAYSITYFVLDDIFNIISDNYDFFG